MALKNIKEDIKNLSQTQLEDKIKDAKFQLKKMKFAHAIQPLDNPMQLRGLRREIALMNTQLTKITNASN